MDKMKVKISKIAILLLVLWVPVFLNAQDRPVRIHSDLHHEFGMTAGLPVTLEGLVGSDGCVWGLQSFGFSAPYKVLDEKLGYNGQNVYEQVKKLLA